MRKKWEHNILEVFFLSWIGILILLELTAPRWIVSVALMLMSVFLLLLTFIPRNAIAYINNPRSVVFTRCIAAVLFAFAIWARLGTTH